VYLLRGPSEKPAFSETLYIGESDLLADRITHHHGKQGKDFWTDVVAFSTGDGSVNRAHAKGAESQLLLRAKESGRVELANKNEPKPAQLGEFDKPRAESFFREIVFVAPLLGVSGFDVIEDASILAKEGENNALSLERAGANAQGYETDDGFVVLEGSSASSDVKPAFQNHPYFPLRNSLLEEGILTEDSQGAVILSRDYEFNSSSAAAAVMCGSSMSGPESWKNKSGKTLKEIYSEQRE
jgi:hypothetical protein